MESKRKSEASDAKIGKKSNKKKSEVIGENVLLNYTYYLDDCQNRKIMLGFDTLTFEAKIIFSYHGRFPVSTTYSGWLITHAYLNNLKNEISKTLPLNGNQKEKKYRIPVDNGSIQLKELELLKLFDMLDFLNIVMFYNNNASESVREYYNQYIAKCMEKNVTKLSNEDFFIPYRSSYVHINYSRLFYEIPLLCSSSIAFNVMLLEL